MEIEAPANFPFRFYARQTIRLSDTAMQIELEVVNGDIRAIPVGLGFHPYFPRNAATRLQFFADWFWLEGPGHLPTDVIRVPPELSFARSSPLPEKWRANCYTGWNGPAVIDQPALGYRVEMSASPVIRDLMFYTPPGQNFFALEPQSHTTAVMRTDSSHRAETPMKILSPGQSFAVRLKLLVRATKPDMMMT